MIGVLALAIGAGLVAYTGLVLTGRIKGATTRAIAQCETCGQGLRAGGDVKLRGVLVGRIGGIERRAGGTCDVRLDLEPGDVDQIPANVGAQVRAKTVFGEKWVELLYPDEPDDATIASDDVIPTDRTIDPLEVETILNVALPLLDAIDPEHLSGALTALSEGFVGHEDAAIKGMEEGIDALRPLNDNRKLLEEGIRQLAESGEVFEDVDQDLLEALANLDRLNRFTTENQALIASNLEKTPRLLREVSELFETRFLDLTKIVDRGATVIGVLAARADDLDRLLDALPKFNASWIRNLSHVCRARQPGGEGGVGARIPGRCWRVHNILSQSQGPYAPGEEPGPDRASKRSQLRELGIADPSALQQLLYSPALDSLRAIR